MIYVFRNNVNCGNKIEAPEGQKIKISFVSFKLERGYDILDLDCRFDSLNIYDGKGYLL